MTIDVEAMEVKVYSLEIETTDHVDPSNALHVIRRDLDMQTIHIKTELTSNSKTNSTRLKTMYIIQNLISTENFI